MRSDRANISAHPTQPIGPFHRRPSVRSLQDRGRGSLLAGLAAGTMIWLTLGAKPALANDDAYLVPEPLPRIALLIGTEDYAALDDLPNIKTDIDAMYQAFEHLGFTDILVLADPCRSDLLDALDELKQRVNTLAPDGGATVVIFFAGHGAMDGHEQFLLTKEFDKRWIGHREYHEIAASTSFLGALLGQVMAGAGLVIIDACRTSFPASENESEAPDDEPECSSEAAVWRKRSEASVARIGYKTPRQLSRVLTAFSTRPGLPAASSTAPGKPSAYVSALHAQLIGDLPVVPDLFAHAYNAVRANPEGDFYTLQPYHQPGGLARAFLKEDDNERRRQETQWREALGTQNSITIENYIYTYPTGSFLRAALRWLDANPHPRSTVDLVPMELGPTEVPHFTATLPRGIRLHANPVAGIADSSRLEATQQHVTLLASDRRGEWLQILNASSEDARFVRRQELKVRFADLPRFWSIGDALDVTTCAQANTESCLAADRAQWTPHPGQVVHLLAVEDPESDLALGTPSAAAFGRALELQLALHRLGVAHEQMSMNVVPRSFAPELSGRLLLKIANEEK